MRKYNQEIQNLKEEKVDFMFSLSQANANFGDGYLCNFTSN